MNKVLKGTIWSVLQQYSSYIVRFLIQIVLARILSPTEYGVLAEVLVFVFICETIAKAGLNTALTQKNNADEVDFSSAFWGSMMLSGVLYLSLFFLSPIIANFYGESIIKNVLRIYSLSFFFNAATAVVSSYALKKYNTKVSFFSSFVSAIIAGSAAIAFALLGFGIWALTIQGLLSSIFELVLLIILVKWHPKLCFNFKRLLSLLKFSWKVLVYSLSGVLLENLYNLSIGKMYGEEKLGFYNRGHSFPQITIGQLRTSISTISLQFFSYRQDDKEKMLKSVSDVTRITSMIVVPMAVGLFIVARPLIVVLLTEKWLPCVFFLQLECLFYVFVSLSSPASSAITATGRSDITMKLELAKLAVSIGSIIAFRSFGIYFLCVARVVISCVFSILGFLICSKIIGYKFKMMIADVWKILLSSLLMGALVYFVSIGSAGNIRGLFIQVIVGIISYGVLIMCFMKKDIVMLKSMFKGKSKNA